MSRAPKGLGSIRQLPDGRWRWQASLGEDPQTGRRIRPARERATREEVLEARAECLAELRKKPGPVHIPEAGSVADWLTEWLRSVASRGLSPNTYINYEGACRVHITPAIGHIRLSKLTSGDVQQMLAAKTPATRRAVRIVLSAAWHAAWSAEKVTDRDVITRIPNEAAQAATGLPANLSEAEDALLSSLRAEPERKRETMREADLGKVLNRISNEPLRARWLIGLVYGTRQSEALGLVWPDLEAAEDGQSAILTVRRARIRPTWAHGCHRLSPCGTTPAKCPRRQWRSPIKGTKTNTIRKIHVGPAMLAILLDYQTRQMAALAKLDNPPKVPWMFTDDKGTPIGHSADQKAWQRFLADSGVSRHYTLHDQRHTAASEAIADPNMDLPTVMALLGWKRISTAEGYIHAGDERLKVAYRRQEKRFLRERGKRASGSAM